MLKLANSSVNIQLFRSFCCSHGNLASFKKQGKVLNKLMFGSDKNKRKWYGGSSTTTVFSSPTSLASTKGQGKESTRRLTVLNKLFMEQVTDLMATGEYSDEIIGYGIQISRVRVTSDFHGVNVFWFARDSENDAEIGRLLKRVAGGLRHELSQLRLIGQVPKLTFVKDKTHGLDADVDSALRQADYGDDYVPSNPTLVPRTEIKLQTELPPEVRRKIDKLENEILYPREDHDPLPGMRHDVLGLEHGSIMNKIKRSLTKSKQAWKQYSEEKNPAINQTQRAESKDMDKSLLDAKMSFTKSLERQKFKKHSTGRKSIEHNAMEYRHTFEEESEVITKDDDFVLEDSDHKNRK